MWAGETYTRAGAWAHRNGPHVVVFLVEAGDQGLDDEPASLPHLSLGVPLELSWVWSFWYDLVYTQVSSFIGRISNQVVSCGAKQMEAASLGK